MTSLLKNEKVLDWICRVLITLNLLMVCGTYISYFQARQQLVSPLIPKGVVSTILYDTLNYTAKAALISACLLLGGLWAYSFKRKIMAIVLFGLAIILYKAMTY